VSGAVTKLLPKDHPLESAKIYASQHIYDKTIGLKYGDKMNHVLTRLFSLAHERKMDKLIAHLGNHAEFPVIKESSKEELYAQVLDVVSCLTDAELLAFADKLDEAKS
jgi:hypothetical protein